MVIVLAANVKVEAEDGACFSLRRCRATKDGQDVWEVVGYYATLGQAARAALDKCLVGRKGVAQVSQLVAMIDRAGERIADACEAAADAASMAELRGAVGAAVVPDDLFDEDEQVKEATG